MSRVNCIVISRSRSSPCILFIDTVTPNCSSNSIRWLSDHICVWELIRSNLILAWPWNCFHFFLLWLIWKLLAHWIFWSTLKLRWNIIMIGSRIWSHQFIQCSRSLLRAEYPSFTFLLSPRVIGCVIAWSRFLLEAVPLGKIKSLGSAYLVLWRFVLTDFWSRIILSGTWASTVALRCSRSLIFWSKPPLRSICLGVSIIRFILSWSWLSISSISSGKVMSLWSSDSVLRRRLILSFDIRWISSWAWHSGSFFFKNLHRWF